MSFAFLHSNGHEPLIRVPSIGLELRVRVPPGASSGAMTCIETTNAPGYGPPLHRHRETEVFHVLNGRYLFEVDGTRLEAGVNDVVVVPGGVAHAFLNITDRPARQFIQILPGLDAATFFLQLGEVLLPGQADRAALDAFGRTWGVEFLGPPLAPVSIPTRTT